jgi:hypothetical protein
MELYYFALEKRINPGGNALNTDGNGVFYLSIRY